MSKIANKRILAERIQKFIKNNDPTIEEMIEIMDSLGTVFGDYLGCPVDVKAKIAPPPTEELR